MVYFKRVLNLRDFPVDSEFIEHADYTIDNHNEQLCDVCTTDDVNKILNTDVTKEEIEAAIKDLKQAKALGPDGIINEMIQCCSNVLVSYLLATYKNILSTATSSSEWTKSVIVPLHK